MLTNWIAEGYSADLFWSLTPTETEIHFDAAAERSRRAHNDRALLAWNIYALPLQKTPRPTLRALQIHNAPRGAQTPDQRLAAAMARANALSKR